MGRAGSEVEPSGLAEVSTVAREGHKKLGPHMLSFRISIREKRISFVRRILNETFDCWIVRAAVVERMRGL
jgi:hypothetical protein